MWTKRGAGWGRVAVAGLISLEIRKPRLPHPRVFCEGGLERAITLPEIHRLNVTSDLAPKK
jgi:hypothetical protein